MERVDLLHFIHEALRHAMLTTNLESGRVDYADSDPTKVIQEAWAQLCEYLGHHAHHEDEIIFPLLDARAPGEADKLSDDHDGIHRLEQAMNTVLDRVAEEPDARVRRVLGREFHRSMQQYTATCLSHFDDEERHLMPRLWALYEDVDLEAAFAPDHGHGRRRGARVHDGPHGDGARSDRARCTPRAHGRRCEVTGAPRNP